MSPGQRHWIEAVYDELGPGLFRHALMILADRASAEDAVQQAFVRLLGRGSLGGIASARAFLHAVLRHEAYRLRQKHAAAPLPLETEFLVAAEGETSEAREERQQLEQALRQLPPEQREVLYLKLWQQMTFAEIAELLRLPPNTAASRYRYALENLRQFMPREDVT